MRNLTYRSRFVHPAKKNLPQLKNKRMGNAWLRKKYRYRAIVQLFSLNLLFCGWKTGERDTISFRLYNCETAICSRESHNSFSHGDIKRFHDEYRSFQWCGSVISVSFLCSCSLYFLGRRQTIFTGVRESI